MNNEPKSNPDNWRIVSRQWHSLLVPSARSAMEWISSLLGASHTSTPVPRETLVKFFEEGKKMFESTDFKQMLCLGFQEGKNVQELVNQHQAAIFESLGVQGSSGLAYLGKIRMQFANDADMLRQFYEFVHLEERALDEAELQDGDFKNKYKAIDAMKEEMALRKEELESMPPEQRHKEMAAVFKRIVGNGQGGQPCCSSQAPCSQVQGPGVPMAAGEGGMAMSEEEQLRFFQSMSRSG